MCIYVCENRTKVMYWTSVDTEINRTSCSKFEKYNLISNFILRVAYLPKYVCVRTSFHFTCSRWSIWLKRSNPMFIAIHSVVWLICIVTCKTFFFLCVFILKFFYSMILLLVVLCLCSSFVMFFIYVLRLFVKSSHLQSRRRSKFQVFKFIFRDWRWILVYVQSRWKKKDGM